MEKKLCNGVSLVRGIDDRVYLRMDAGMAYGVMQEFDLALHSCGGFENSVRMEDPVELNFDEEERYRP